MFLATVINCHQLSSTFTACCSNIYVAFTVQVRHLPEPGRRDNDTTGECVRVYNVFLSCFHTIPTTSHAFTYTNSRSRQNRLDCQMRVTRIKSDFTRDLMESGRFVYIHFKLFRQHLFLIRPTNTIDQIRCDSCTICYRCTNV